MLIFITIQKLSMNKLNDSSFILSFFTSFIKTSNRILISAETKYEIAKINSLWDYQIKFTDILIDLWLIFLILFRTTDFGMILFPYLLCCFLASTTHSMTKITTKQNDALIKKCARDSQTDKLS